MKRDWPTREQRERWEMGNFIKAYEKLGGRRLKIQEERDKPDYVAIDQHGCRFGVELTAVYRTDRTVPDEHIRRSAAYTAQGRRFDDLRPLIEQYLRRVVDHVKGKIEKAASYDTSAPLILSVYLNDDMSFFLSPDDLEALQADKVFAQMEPYSEVVFWPLPNNQVMSVSSAP